MRRRSLIVLLTLVTSACSQAKLDESAIMADSSAAAIADAGGSLGKRVAPPAVTPVTVGSLRIEAVPWGEQRGFAHNGGYIAAVDSAGDELWTLEVYDVERDPEREADVQDVFISQLALGTNADEVVVTDERGRRYVVNVKTRTVRRDG